MQTTENTAGQVIVRVGDDKTPITLTDSAVEALQGEAAGRAQEYMDEIDTTHTAHTGNFDTLDLDGLLELRDNLNEARLAVDVLIECRPLSEVDIPDEG